MTAAELSGRGIVAEVPVTDNVAGPSEMDIAAYTAHTCPLAEEAYSSKEHGHHWDLGSWAPSPPPPYICFP